MDDFNMIWIADIAALLIILIATLKDARKGFIKAVFGLVISVASIAVAFLCADMVTELTDGAFGLQDTIVNGLSTTFAGWGLNFDVSQGGVQDALSSNSFFKAMPYLVKVVMEKLPTVDSETVVYLNEHLASVVGVFATNVVVGIALFVLCRLVLSFVEKILTSLVEHITLLNALNTLLGATVGLLKGVITVALLCMLFTTLPVFGGLMEKMPETLFVYEWFFANNPLTKILAYFM